MIAIAAGLLLTGYGSAEVAAPAAPVESSSASGAVASGDVCPQGAPARGMFRGRYWGINYSDGVLGHVYNQTSSPIWLWSEQKTDPTPCRVDPGQGASFAATTGRDMDTKDAASWRGTRWWKGVDGGHFWMLATASPDPSSPGVAIGLDDPFSAKPQAYSVYRTAAGTACASDDVMFQSARLSEGDEYRLKGGSQGDVLVKRLDDNKEVAVEWTDSWHARDWARLDIFVDAIGRC